MVPKLLAATTQFNLSGPGTTVSSNGHATILLEKLISNVIGILTIVAFIYFTIQVILNGFQFFSTEGDKAKMEKAKKRLTDSIVGVVIVVIAFGFGTLVAKLTGVGDIFDLNAILSTLGL